MKYLLKKLNEDHGKFSSALLEFRNTPNVSGRSPAQMFFGRRLRGILPHLPGANDLDIANAITGADHRKTLMEAVETKPGTPLKQFPIGQRVLLQHPLTKSWDSSFFYTPSEKTWSSLFESSAASL